MSEKASRTPEQSEQTDLDGTISGLGKITVLEALATETTSIDPYSSNMSTPQGRAEFDDH